MNPVLQSSAADSKRRLPFELSIRRPGRHTGTEQISCKECLRVVPGKREVFDASWNGRGVIVKVFLRRFRGREHLKKEWDGLTELRHRGINAPQPLFYGHTANPASSKGYAVASGKWAIVMEKIADSTTLVEVFEKTAEKEERAELLAKLGRELASQHEKGIFQKDLNFGNLLLDGEKIITLDPAEMQFFSRQVEREKSILQLTSLTCNLSDDDKEHIRSIWMGYFRMRGWEFGESDERLLWEQTAAHRRNGIRYLMKKCMRTNNRYLRIRTGRHVAVFNREFCAEAEAVQLMERIDEPADKNEWNRQEIVIKRYSHKGLFDSLSQTIKGSQAKRGWLDAHRLRALDKAEPKPLAYIERRRSGLIWESYLVTEYNEA